VSERPDRQGLVWCPKGNPLQADKTDLDIL